MSELLDCGHPPSEHSESTTGYGYDEQGRKFCYACCAENDKKIMDETGRYTLYLTMQSGKDEHPRRYVVTNWPGSLQYAVMSYSRSKHNWGGIRTDVWFKDYQGRTWHGYQIGRWTEICHVKRIKA